MTGALAWQVKKVLIKLRYFVCLGEEMVRALNLFFFFCFRLWLSSPMLFVSLSLPLSIIHCVQP
ncbi:hypothetical protein IC575_003658 [Cucumis melo]